MKRRDFVGKAAAGVAATSALAVPGVADAAGTVRWRMAASWPTSLDTLYGGAKLLADRVKQLTNGKFQIRVYAAGELVGGLQVFDAVQQGTVEMGHTAAYYYIGKNQSLAFDTTLPFGLTTRQQNSWMYYGGGNELMNKAVYSDFGILSLPAGNTTCQMGGWFRKEIPNLAALKGLKMRIPGFGGRVMATLGVNVQTLAAAEIYPALERGVIDATEWVGPYDDEKLGFYQIAKNYYAPSWWEPNAQLSIMINRKAYAKLPKEYQEALHSAAAEANVKMIAHYDAQNPPALKRLLGKGVKLHKFSDDIMNAAQESAFGMYEDIAAKDKTWRKIYTEWRKWRDMEYAWFNTNEQVFANFAFPKVPEKDL